MFSFLNILFISYRIVHFFKDILFFRIVVSSLQFLKEKRVPPKVMNFCYEVDEITFDALLLKN